MPDLLPRDQLVAILRSFDSEPVIQRYQQEWAGLTPGQILARAADQKVLRAFELPTAGECTSVARVGRRLFVCDGWQGGTWVIEAARSAERLQSAFSKTTQKPSFLPCMPAQGKSPEMIGRKKEGPHVPFTSATAVVASPSAGSEEPAQGPQSQRCIDLDLGDRLTLTLAD